LSIERKIIFLQEFIFSEPARFSKSNKFAREVNRGLTFSTQAARLEGFIFSRDVEAARSAMKRFPRERCGTELNGNEFTFGYIQPQVWQKALSPVLARVA
jgi:hypothetical protein